MTAELMYQILYLFVWYAPVIIIAIVILWIWHQRSDEIYEHDCPAFEEKEPKIMNDEWLRKHVQEKVKPSDYEELAVMNQTIDEVLKYQQTED